MKPPRFEYHAPGSLDEAVALLQRYGGEARVLAGGQSLVPMMNFRIAQPAALIDLNPLAALAYITEAGDTVRIGAMTRQRTAEFSSLVAQRLPLLRAGLGWVAHLPIRSRGTIGGSLAHADPAAELPMLLHALDGEVTACGPDGERHITASDLFLAPLATSHADDEILTEVRFKAPPPGAGCAIEEFARRKGDFALAAIAVVLERDGDRCVKVRIAAGGVGPVPSRLQGAEAILEQQGVGDAAIAAAAAKVAEIVEPMTDHHASADYRRHLAGVLTRRALTRARTDA